MKLMIVLASLALASCARAPVLVGMPYDEMRNDTGTIAGSWREIRRDGRSVGRGYVVSISTFFTFAAEKGCVANGGVLRALGANRFAIERYENSLPKEGCATWQTGPDIAPFDGREVTIARSGDILTVEGGGRRVELRRIALRGPGV